MASIKGSCWSITINNPTAEDLETWKSIRLNPWVKDAQGQLEEGENKTPHLQALLKTDYVRFSQVKKLLPRAHIEKARNQNALQNYVKKEETRLAEVAVDRTATPRLVQERLTSMVEQHIFHKGIPARWNYTLSRDCKSREWHKVVLYDEEHEFKEVVHMNREWINHNSDKLIDAVVEQLIEEGYYGIEFVISNNLVRNGYKKFLSSIIIRHYASCQEVCEDQADRPPSPIQEEID